MLIKFKKQFEKIAMGLLSFMPDEKDVKVLQDTMHKYEMNENWHLYLWKQEEEVVGAIGFKIEDELSLVIQHISVNPSYRDIGIGKQMIDGIKAMFDEKYAVCANDYLEDFFNLCTVENEVEDSQEE